MPDCITSVTPTLCRLLGIVSPAQSTSATLDAVIAQAGRILNGEAAEKCLVYAPDAIGAWMIERYANDFAEVLRQAPIRTPMDSVAPTWTPICFASMFSGAMPGVHGIIRPERRQLTCDTLIDSLARAGKRVAIVAVTGSSIDRIFRGRNVDYFSEIYDAEVTGRALELLEADQHDFILAYHQEYDDRMHETTPESEESLAAFRRHMRSFSELLAVVNRVWRRRRRVVAFTPDHGCHIDPSNGLGAHGLSSPEDMRIDHFWGVYPAEPYADR